MFLAEGAWRGPAIDDTCNSGETGRTSGISGDAANCLPSKPLYEEDCDMLVSFSSTRPEWRDCVAADTFGMRPGL
jgi:hypothetical protein